MKTVIRKYDKGRVAILPSQGVPEEYARWLSAYAVKHKWADFKIVQTQDEFKQLGIVCKPNQWVKLIRYFRRKGEPYPLNYEDEFINICLKVLTEDKGSVELKPSLSKGDEEILKKAKEIALETDINSEELEKDTWKKDDTN